MEGIPCIVSFAPSCRWEWQLWIFTAMFDLLRGSMWCCIWTCRKFHVHWWCRSIRMRNFLPNIGEWNVWLFEEVFINDILPEIVQIISNLLWFWILQLYCNRLYSEVRSLVSFLKFRLVLSNRHGRSTISMFWGTSLSSCSFWPSIWVETELKLVR